MMDGDRKATNNSGEEQKDRLETDNKLLITEEARAFSEQINRMDMPPIKQEADPEQAVMTEK